MKGVRAIILVASLAQLTCQTHKPPVSANDPFLDSLSEKTFYYFWDLTNPANGLVPDRWPTPSFSSIAASGIGLTSYW